VALIQAGRPKAMAVLLDALHKGPPQRQAAAADALAYARKVNAEPLLQALTSEDALVRQSAAEALGRLGHRPAMPRLITLLSDASPWVRRAAIRALGHLGDSNSVEALSLRLSDASPWVRSSAAYALGAMRAQQAVTTLILALEDPNPQVRRNAAWALGRIDDSAALPKLRALEADTALDGRVAQEAYAAIYAIQRPVWRRLASLVQKGSTRRVAGSA
jgi:HEAT repeat protein